MARPSKRQIIASIYELLGGRPVLIGFPRGTKGPKDNGWQKTSWEETQAPEYQAALEQGNLGVCLGPQSVLEDDDGRVYHLCSIDIDAEGAVEGFEALNPWLEEALQTRGFRGRQYWLWLDAEEEYVPPDVNSFVKLAYAKVDPESGAYLRERDSKRPWGEWRCNTGAQTVIWGKHPEGVSYKRLTPDGVGPARVRFSEIVWPEDVFVPWRRDAMRVLEEKYGPLWHEGKHGRLILNPPSFAAKYAAEHEVFFEATEEEFYEYVENRGLWRIQTVDSVKWEFSEDFGRMARFHEVGQLYSVRTNGFLTGMADLLKGCIERRDVFQARPGIVHLKNCMLDLEAQPPKAMAFRPDFFSRNQIPIDYDPEGQAPLWKGLLEYALDEEDANLLQRWAGGLLVGVNLPQRIMILSGGGGTGKSTIMRVLRALIGKENSVGLRTEHLVQRFEASAFIGKTFLIGSDVPGNFLNQEGAETLKRLVGGDPVPAEKKAGEVIQLDGIFNVGITTNSFLTVKLDGDISAWLRRLMLIHFSRPKPENPDPRLVDKILQSEASGVLNWMIEGALGLLFECEPENGGDLRLTAVQRQRVENLLSASDSLRQFIANSIEPAPGANVTKHELREAYVDYCEAYGWQPMAGKQVGSKIDDLMMELYRVVERNDIPRGEDKKRQRGFANVRLAMQIPAQERAGMSPPRDGEEPF